jgi:hypothetical protein
LVPNSRCIITVQKSALFHTSSARKLPRIRSFAYIELQISIMSEEDRELAQLVARYLKSSGFKSAWQHFQMDAAALLQVFYSDAGFMIFQIFIVHEFRSSY